MGCPSVFSSAPLESPSLNAPFSNTRAYNTDNTLASISYSGAAIGTYSYGWDDNKNKTSETITGTMSNYGFTVPTGGYDDEDRLVGWERVDSNLDQSWNLSLVGDWDSFTENSTTQNRTHGDAHEILTADSQSVTHDVKGNQTGLPSNLTTSTSGLTLEWDFENKLHAADVDGTSGADVLQKFDALGRRISRDDGTTTTVFVPSGQQTIADYTAGTAASSPTYRYVYASYIDEPVMRAGSTSTAKLYYHRSQQYSVTALTDATGKISERYAYDAYGKLSVLDGGGTVLSGSAYGNRYTYTGREWDEELSLYHYRARMYSPYAGHFISRDPMGYIDGLSMYRGHMDMRFVDPQGLSINFPVPSFTQGGLVFGVLAVPVPAIGGGLFFRIQASAKTGECDCGPDCIQKSSSYSKRDITAEAGYYAGLMASAVHFVTPVIEELGQCPPRGEWITGGITIRAVLGPYVGTCRWAFGGSRWACSGNIRWTNMRKGFNIQVSGYIQIKTVESGCSGNGNIV